MAIEYFFFTSIDFGFLESRIDQWRGQYPIYIGNLLAIDKHDDEMLSDMGLKDTYTVKFSVRLDKDKRYDGKQAIHSITDELKSKSSTISVFFDDMLQYSSER